MRWTKGRRPSVQQLKIFVEIRSVRLWDQCTQKRAEKPLRPGILDRHRLDQDRVYQAVDCRIAADAAGERHYRHGGEKAIGEQRPQGVMQVIQHTDWTLVTTKRWLFQPPTRRPHGSNGLARHSGWMTFR